MRFKDFLLREEAMHMSLEHGLTYIKDHCQRFLSEIRSTENFLYRGMNMPVVDQVIAIDHIKERAPRDSSKAFNVFFNAGIEFAYSIPMVRAKSVFCSGDSKDAGIYGNVYFMFPQGQFKYLWSPQVTDSYVSDVGLFQAFVQELGQFDKEAFGKPLAAENAFAKILDRSGGNISTACHNLKINDVMVEEVFEENEMHVTAEEVERALRKSFEKMYFLDQDLNEALSKHKEILVYDSDGNYFIPREMIVNLLQSDKKYDGWTPEEFLVHSLF